MGVHTYIFRLSWYIHIMSIEKALTVQTHKASRKKNQMRIYKINKTQNKKKSSSAIFRIRS